MDSAGNILQGASGGSPEILNLRPGYHEIRSDDSYQESKHLSGPKSHIADAFRGIRLKKQPTQLLKLVLPVPIVSPCNARPCKPSFYS